MAFYGSNRIQQILGYLKTYLVQKFASKTDLTSHVSTDGQPGVKGHVSLYDGDLSYNTYMSGVAASSSHTHDSKYLPMSAQTDLNNAVKITNVNQTIGGNKAFENDVTVGTASTPVSVMNTASDVSNIKEVIPSTATSSNKLATMSDIPTVPVVTGKADKVSNATDGNFAGLDANGNLTDSGHKHSDYMPTKTIDSTPTSGSNNLVSSGGVYTAIQQNSHTKLSLSYDVTSLSGGWNIYAKLTIPGDVYYDEFKPVLLYCTSNIDTGQSSSYTWNNLVISINQDYGLKSILNRNYWGCFATKYKYNTDTNCMEVYVLINETSFAVGTKFTFNVETSIDNYIISGELLRTDSAGINAIKGTKWDEGQSKFASDIDIFTTHDAIDYLSKSGGTVSGDVVLDRHYDYTQSQWVDSNLTVSGIITVNGSDYAEKFDSMEDCPEGRFVTLDGERIRLAQPNDDYILGVTSEAPAIIGDKDNPGTPVGLVGKLWVEHDGTAKVNGYVTCGDDGIATESEQYLCYRVMAVDGNRCKILVK